MKNNVVKIALTSLTYGCLLVAVILYILSDYTISSYLGGLEQSEPTLIAGFIVSIVSLIANIIITVKCKGWLRAVSILGTLLSLIIGILIAIPLAFSLS